MNCPMKNLLMEFTTTAPATATTTAASPASPPASTAQKATKTSVYSCVNSCVDSCVTAGKNQCECCALLAFKYIAACEDVGEFAHPLRRFK